jgi:hypothetical protein
MSSKETLKFDMSSEPQKGKNENELISKKEILKRQLNLHNTSRDESMSDIDMKLFNEHSKKPPTNPLKTQQIPTKDSFAESKSRARLEKLRFSIESPSSQVNLNNFGLSGKISPRISPYHKENQAKTHLLNKQDPNIENIKPSESPLHIKKTNSYQGFHKSVEKENIINLSNKEMTFKDSDKKQSRTNPTRNANSHSHTHRPSPGSRLDDLDHHPSTQSTQVDPSLKKRLEFDEDRIQPLVTEVLQHRADSRANMPSQIKPLEIQTLTSNSKPVYKPPEDHLSTIQSRHHYLSTEASNFQHTQPFDPSSCRTVASFTPNIFSQRQDEKPPLSISSSQNFHPNPQTLTTQNHLLSQLASLITQNDSHQTSERPPSTHS